MLTARGWWFLILAGALALVGVLLAAPYAPGVGVLGVTLLAWFGFEWALFAARFRAVVPSLTVTRSLRQGGRPVATAWANVPCKIRIELATHATQKLPLVFVEDRLPAGLKPTAGETSGITELTPDSPVVIAYDVKPRSPGVLRFEGVSVRIADLCGFFYRRAFVRDRVEFLVLPQLSDEEGRQRADKRFNSLPPPGVHRLRKPGGGGDLLDLRDYRAGDPPKMIAWKASARRDRLITKELESDVPVRCVLFLDTAQGVRVGPPGETLVARLAELTAVIAQAAAANRDIVGLTPFDEDTSDPMPPARTRVHTVRMLARLAEAAALVPDAPPATAETLLRYAHPLAEELYPDLLEADVNSRPFGLYWLPLLDTRWGWLVPAVMLSPVLLMKREVAEVAAEVANVLGGRGYVVWAFVILTLLPSLAGGLFWLVFAMRGFLPPRSATTRKRKQLAAVFAGLDCDSPAAVERYLKDDAAFAERAGTFLSDHHVRLPAAGPADADRLRQGAKATTLADALLRAVFRAKDNELYVIIADLTAAADDCEPLVKAVRVARSRHHHVLVLLPWPDGVPAPVEGNPNGRGTGAGGKPVAAPLPTAKRGRLRIAQMVQAGLVFQYQRKYVELRAAVTRVGGAVVRVGSADATAVVLDRLDRLRGGRGRR